MYYFTKLIITALIIVIVSEVAKKSTFIGAIIISIPLTSLLAFSWLYIDTKDYQKVIDLSYGTIFLYLLQMVYIMFLYKTPFVVHLIFLYLMFHKVIQQNLQLDKVYQKIF